MVFRSFSASTESRGLPPCSYGSHFCRERLSPTVHRIPLDCVNVEFGIDTLETGMKTPRELKDKQAATEEVEKEEEEEEEVLIEVEGRAPVRRPHRRFHHYPISADRQRHRARGEG
mmetsp:Transcript_3739/g.8920  ORF Transcript_3739/g.8920 Transcript_3739/m.8920 type:complete len:116 (+) Transcript_3739:501-848(+)